MVVEWAKAEPAGHGAAGVQLDEHALLLKRDCEEIAYFMCSHAGVLQMGSRGERLNSYTIPYLSISIPANTRCLLVKCE